MVILIAVIVLTVVFLLLGGEEAAAPTDDDAVSNFSQSPLNATYQIKQDSIILENGESEQEIYPGSTTKIYTSVFGEPVFGDLNDDGDEDAALVLIYDLGGTGTFYYLAVALNEGGGYKGLNSVLLGDRISPQNVSIENNEILVRYAVRAPADPMIA